VQTGRWAWPNKGAAPSQKKTKNKGIEGKKGDPKNYGGEKQISTPENRPRKRRK